MKKLSVSLLAVGVLLLCACPVKDKPDKTGVVTTKSFQKDLEIHWKQTMASLSGSKGKAIDPKKRTKLMMSAIKQYEIKVVPESRSGIYGGISLLLFMNEVVKGLANAKEPALLVPQYYTTLKPGQKELFLEIYSLGVRIWAESNKTDKDILARSELFNIFMGNNKLPDVAPEAYVRLLERSEAETIDAIPIVMSSFTKPGVAESVGFQRPQNEEQTLEMAGKAAIKVSSFFRSARERYR
ncbi:MAG TPA: hypothetical protein VEA59_02620 [Patescibacteria group bacterium]|nr:hypothetical protein [Patescibacteria group bacterium]